jgi:hypothetical protein
MWLQLVGTGITTTWAAHFGAVLAAASWPAITVHNILESQVGTRYSTAHETSSQHDLIELTDWQWCVQVAASGGHSDGGWIPSGARWSWPWY